MPRFATLAALTLALAAFAGCSSGSKYDKFGYSTVEKDGRLYVWPVNSAEYQFFVKTGDPGKSITRVGAGPDGMTIVGPDAATIDNYLGK